jgi:hypothetical protein
LILLGDEVFEAGVLASFKVVDAMLDAVEGREEVLVVEIEDPGEYGNGELSDVLAGGFGTLAEEGFELWGEVEGDGNGEPGCGMDLF